MSVIEKPQKLRCREITAPCFDQSSDQFLLRRLAFGHEPQPDVFVGCAGPGSEFLSIG